MLSKPVILQSARAALPEFFHDELKKRGDLFIKSRMSASELEEVLLKTDIMVVSGGTFVTKELLDRMPRLKLITEFGVGYDKIDLKELYRRKIPASNTPKLQNDDIADIVFAMMLSLSRKLFSARDFITTGKWQQGGAFPLAKRLSGIKLGIVGLGNIGTEIARRAVGFKMQIGYFGRHEKPVPYRYFTALEDMSAWCDALVISAALCDQTRGCVNEKVLKALGKDGYLVNVARGPIVDTAALINALKKHEIKGAALDVYDHEPNVPNELIGMENVLLTPHIASGTEESRAAMSRLCLENIDAFLSGARLKTPIPGSWQP